VRRIRPFACVLLLAACGDATPASTAAEPVVRDSAGITIVENIDPQWGDGEAWRLSKEPVLEIGMVEGPEAYEFARITGATRLEENIIALLDGVTAEIRFFDADGAHLRTVGGEGAGPGELSHPTGLRRIGGDSLVVFEQGAMRISIFDQEGTFARSARLELTDAGKLPFAQNAFSDGGLLTLLSEARPPETQPGRFRDSVTFARCDPEGRYDRVIARSLGQEFMVHEFAGRSRAELVPFGAAYARAIGREELHIADTGQYEVHTRSAYGELRRIVRSQSPRRPVERKDVDLLRRERMAGVGEATRARIEAVFRAVEIPDSMPMISTMLVDGAENLWVQRYMVPSDDHQRWDVFDPRGRWQGTLTFPADLRVMEIGSEYLLGVYRDDLDVEYMRMYALIKPETAG